MKDIAQFNIFPEQEEDNYASFSECRNYRYYLRRIWDSEKPMVMFIGLNPSTANEFEDDPTIRSVCRIAKANGYGGVYMMNCWPYVSTDPTKLKRDELTDKWNNDNLTVIAAYCKDVVFAWGSFDVVRETGRDLELMEMFPRAKVLHVNKNGSPKHPLYCKSDSILLDYQYVLEEIKKITSTQY